jgi:hypothetical protein
MSPFTTSWLRRGAFAVLACLTLLGSGCLPGVVWLPDSSGFLYIDGTGDKFTRVVHFNLATKQSRVLIEKTEETVQPGLSPDGKRIAVARYTAPKGEKRTLQVVILDDKGKELSRSKDFAWKEAPPKGNFQVKMPPALYWSPHGDKVIVYCDMTAGLYDVKAQTMQVLDETVVINIAGTPILPDKSGFLAMRGKIQEMDSKQIPVYALVDWQGKTTEWKIPAEVLPRDDKAGGNEDLMFMTMFFVPPLYSSRWDRGVAEVTFSGNTLAIDTVKKEVSLKKTALVETGDGKKAPVVKLGEGRFLHSRYPLGPGVEVRTVLLERKKDEKTFGFLPKLQVELLVPGQKDPKVLADAEMVVATPSPNGEWLALRCSREDRKTAPDRILVINRKGEIVEVGAPK